MFFNKISRVSKPLQTALSVFWLTVFLASVVSCNPVKVAVDKKAGVDGQIEDSTETDSGGDEDTVTPPGALTFAFSDYVGLGRADVDSDGAGALAAVSNQLVAIKSNGQSEPVPPGVLSVAGGTSLALLEADPTIDVACLVPVASGTLVVAKTKDTNVPYFADGSSQVAVIGTDGVVHHVVSAGGASPATIEIATTNCATAVQQSSDGGLFALGANSKSVWSINTTTWAAAVVVSLSGDESITAYLATDHENIFYSSSDGSVTYTKWFKVATTTTVDMGYPNNRISSPMSLPGGQGFTFLSSGKAGGVVLSVVGGTALRSFIEPIYPTGNSTSWSGPVNLHIGDWIFTGNTALKPLNSKMASNPFWRSYGRFQGLVDLDNQVYFDGSNLVKVAYEDGKIKVRHHKSILQDATLRLKIQAVFGPAQGFTDKWVGFATNETFIESGTTNLFWVEINATTGVVDSSRIFKLQAENMPAYWNNNADNIPDFTPYQLTKTDNTKKVIGFGGTLGASVVDLTFDESDPSNKKLVLGAAKGGVYSYYHPRALIHGPRLYINASYYDGTPNAGFHDKIFYYDADRDTVTSNAQGISTISLLSQMNATQNKCNGTIAYGLVQIPGQPGPSMLYCSSDYKVRLATFTDFTFSAVAYDRGTTVETPGNPANPDTSDNYGDFASGTMNNIDWMQVYPLSSNMLAIGLGRRQEVRLINPVDTTTTTVGNVQVAQTYGAVAFTSLETEGRVEFWKLFIGEGDSPAYAPNASTLARWDDTTLFASGTLTTGGTVSWLIDLGTREATELESLRDFTVSSALRVDDDTFMVVGTQSGAASQPVRITLNNSGVETGRSNSTTLIKEAVEFNAQ